MARQTDLAKRALLVEQTAEYLSVHGLAEASLRDVAAALGTTSRMLVYYFGTKEALFSATLDHHRQDFRAVFSDVNDADGLRRALITLLRDMTTGAKEPAARLLVQMLGAGTSASSEYHLYARRAISDMTEALREVLQRLGASDASGARHSTVIGAAFRGMLVDRFTTSSSDEVDDAAAAMVEMLVDLAVES